MPSLEYLIFLLLLFQHSFTLNSRPSRIFLRHSRSYEIMKYSFQALIPFIYCSRYCFSVPSLSPSLFSPPFLYSCCLHLQLSPSHCPTFSSGSLISLHPHGRFFQRISTSPNSPSSLPSVTPSHFAAVPHSPQPRIPPLPPSRPYTV